MLPTNSAISNVGSLAGGVGKGFNGASDVVNVSKKGFGITLTHIMISSTKDTHYLAVLKPVQC